MKSQRGLFPRALVSGGLLGLALIAGGLGLATEPASAQSGAQAAVAQPDVEDRPKARAPMQPEVIIGADRLGMPHEVLLDSLLQNVREAMAGAAGRGLDRDTWDGAGFDDAVGDWDDFEDDQDRQDAIDALAWAQSSCRDLTGKDWDDFDSDEDRLAALLEAQKQQEEDADEDEGSSEIVGDDQPRPRFGARAITPRVGSVPGLQQDASRRLREIIVDRLETRLADVQDINSNG